VTWNLLLSTDKKGS